MLSRIATKKQCPHLRPMMQKICKRMKFYNFSDPDEIVKLTDLLKRNSITMQRNSSSKYPPLKPPNLEVHELKGNDGKAKEEALQFLLQQFMVDETLQYNLKFTEKEAAPFYGDVIDACSHDALSIMVRDIAAGNKLVAIYLNQILRRHHDGQSPREELYGGKKKYSQNVEELCKIVRICESSIWSLLPANVVQCCNNVFLSVHRDYHQLGIGRQLVELVEWKMRHENGDIQAALSEVSASGTQKIASELGYYPLLTIPYSGLRDEKGNRIVKHAKDGAESLQLICKPYWY